VVMAVAVVGKIVVVRGSGSGSGNGSGGGGGVRGSSGGV
jgi:hypothetical protein